MSLKLQTSGNGSKPTYSQKGMRFTPFDGNFGQGMPLFKQNGRGDLYVKIIVLLPNKLTSLQEKLLRKLQKEGI